MDEALAKIRPHTSSSLPHQRSPANLLVALESTFTEQNAEQSPTAYFAALLTTLDGTIQKKDLALGEGDVLPAELYLLALIAPFVPTPIIQTNLKTILALTAPLFPSLTSQAPALRSQLALYHIVFRSLNRSQLETPGIRQSFASISYLCIDPRPKVRKKAADVVQDVLATPPAPLARHPFAAGVADWVKSILSEAGAGPLFRPKEGKRPEPSGPETAIHMIAFLRPVLPNLPPTVSKLDFPSRLSLMLLQAIPSIIHILLTLPRLGNTYLTQATYSILSDLFSLLLEGGSTDVHPHLSETLKVILSSSPSKSDTILSPAWVQVLGNATQVYSALDADSCATELGKVWKAVWTFLESSDPLSRKAASQSLVGLCRCFTPTLITAAFDDATPTSTLGSIITQTTKALHSLAFAQSIPHLLSITSSLIASLRYRVGSRSSPTAAERLLFSLIGYVGELRVQKGFEYKEDADATLATAMQVLGPEVLLRILPLNLEPADRYEILPY